MKRLIAVVATGLACAAIAQQPSAAPSQTPSASRADPAAPYPESHAIASSTPMAGNDLSLAQRIVDALNQGGEFRNSSITVTARDGAVLLEGSVASESEANDAGSIATRLAGNSHVTNQLVVR